MGKASKLRKMRQQLDLKNNKSDLEQIVAKTVLRPTIVPLDEKEQAEVEENNKDESKPKKQPFKVEKKEFPIFTTRHKTESVRAKYKEMKKQLRNR